MDIAKEIGKFDIQVTKVDDFKISFYAECGCGATIEESVDWEGYPDDDNLDLWPSIVEDTVDKVFGIWYDYMCPDCEAKDAADYDRQVTSDWYRGR